MSLWQLSAAVGGFAKANGAGGDAIPEEDAKRLTAKLLADRPDLQVK